MNRKLGRLVPPDFTHVAKYPLSAAVPTKPVPVVLGIEWYSSFDRPVKIGARYWIGASGDLGYVRGGHAICSVPAGLSDLTEWWDFYNQGDTGECVGFSSSRMMSLLNRARYDAPWLYFAAQDEAGQPRDPDSGTYVRSAFEVLRTQGDKTPKQMTPRSGAGISAYRWASSADEIVAALDPNGISQYRTLQGIPLANSWGRSFPHIVWLPFETLDYLLSRQGEAAVPTDY